MDNRHTSMMPPSTPTEHEIYTVVFPDKDKKAEVFTNKEEAIDKCRQSPDGTKVKHGSIVIHERKIEVIPPKKTGDSNMAVMGKEKTVSAASQKAIDDWSNRDLSKIKIETPATDEDKHLLADATEIGESLSKHPDFVKQLQAAIEAKEIDDYKSILSLRLMERYLTPSQLAKLPFPGTTREQAEKMRRPGFNEPLIWDKIKLEGRKWTSFYAEMAKSFPPGQKATKRLEQIRLAKTNPNDPTIPEEIKEWGDPRLESEASRCTRDLRQITNAVKTAAHIRIQMDRIKQMSDIEVFWIRDDNTKGEQPEPNVDHTKLEIKGFGDILKSQKPLSIGSKKVKGQDKRLTISQFLAWNITPEVIRIGTLKALRDSVEKKEPTGQQKKTTEASKSRNVSSFREAMENLEAFVSWIQQSEGTKQFKIAESNLSGEDAWTMYEIYKSLQSVFRDKEQVNKATEHEASLNQNVA